MAIAALVPPFPRSIWQFYRYSGGSDSFKYTYLLLQVLLLEAEEPLLRFDQFEFEIDVCRGGGGGPEGGASLYGEITSEWC